MPKPPDVVLVQLPGNPRADADTVAAALARCDALDLFSIDGVPTWVRDGERVQITGLVLRELISKYVAVKAPVMHDDGKVEVIYVPPPIDEQTLRSILTGHNPHPRFGGDVPGGRLADRLPKVSAAALGLAA